METPQNASYQNPSDHDSNPYRPPAASAFLEFGIAPKTIWRRVVQNVVIVLKGGAYGIIAFECIILFGAIGLRLFNGSRFSVSEHPLAWLVPTTAVVAGLVTFPVSTWIMFRRQKIDEASPQPVRATVRPSRP